MKLDDLRLDGARAKVTSGPFPVLEVSDYLPADLYAALLEAYPDPKQAGVRHGMKNYLKSGTAAFAAFQETSPVWAQLLEYVDSDEFLSHVYDVAQPTIRAARGAWGARPWCRNGVPLDRRSRPQALSNRLLRRSEYLEVETGIELSSMENGHRITPHSDAPYKLVSILVYFPFPDWEQEWGGGTQFFRPRTAAAERRWCNADVNHVKHFGEEGLERFDADMECFHTAQFSHNRLAMFCKSDHTFHAVAQVACPDNRRRNALVLNVNIKESVPPSRLGQVERWIRKRVRWLQGSGETPLRPVGSGDSYN